MAQPSASFATPSSPPVRLPGHASWWNEFIGFSSSLWLDDDWLLLADSHMMRDDYRRFPYRDIQALQMRRTARGLVYNLVFGGFAGLSALIVAISSATSTSSVGTLIFWAIATVVFLAAFLVNISRGPTCRCRLQTAASRVPLASLSRVRPARRAFERIRERIAAAQGALIAPEAAVERMNQHLTQATQRIAQAASIASPATATPVAAVAASPPPPPVAPPAPPVPPA